MKKGNRASLIKNILGILFIIIAIVFAICSTKFSQDLILGGICFGICGVYVLLMPVDPFLKIINFMKDFFK